MEGVGEQGEGCQIGEDHQDPPRKGSHPPASCRYALVNYLLEKMLESYDELLRAQAAISQWFPH